MSLCLRTELFQPQSAHCVSLSIETACVFMSLHGNCFSHHNDDDYNNNNNALFCVLFIQNGAHNPVQSKEPKQSEQTSDSWKRRDFKSYLKDLNVFDYLTLQGKLFQTDGYSIRKISLSKRVRAHREWKMQKKSVAGGLVCKLSGVQSSRHP